MAFSAFKSSTRKTTSSSTTPPLTRPTVDNSPKKAPIRRSRSISAVPRTTLGASSSSASDVFLNKRDNPLFCNTGSTHDLESIDPDNSVASTPRERSGLGSANTNQRIASSVAVECRRGRSAARNADVAGRGRKEVGRSISRADTGRCNRSVSRCPVSSRSCVNSDVLSETEQECSSVASFGNRRKSNLDVGSDRDESDLRKSNLEVKDRLKVRHLLKPSDDSVSILSRSHATTWEGGVSTASSLSGAEEKNINAVYEQMKSVQMDGLEGDDSASGIHETVRTEVRHAIFEIQNDLENAIQRRSTSAIAITNVADIPPDLVSPSAVELVLDIRREYAKKLEQSKEWARKLQTDLAIEEHRGQELSRILKEVLPDPKTSNVQKSRPARKASIERRKMSKRLTEEAMAYFDECISISTFDSSDLSSPEDQPLSIGGVTTPVDHHVSLNHAPLIASATDSCSSCFMDKKESCIQDQVTQNQDPSGLTVSSKHQEPNLNRHCPISASAAHDRKSRFSFAFKPTEILELQKDFHKYIQKSNKCPGESEVSSKIVRSNSYDLSEYNLQATAQSIVFDRVVMRNRLHSGSLLLCGGNKFSLFASFI